MTEFDVIIIGGGIAGAKYRCRNCWKLKSLIVEAEDQCGYHSTGRSAAFYLESYGGSDVAKLTSASHDFLDSPPKEFAEIGIFESSGGFAYHSRRCPRAYPSVKTRVVEREELELLVPGIGTQWRRALFEPGCADIDVARLHSAYLRQFRRNGGEIALSTRVVGAKRMSGRWGVLFADGSSSTSKNSRQCCRGLG